MVLSDRGKSKVLLVAFFGRLLKMVRGDTVLGKLLTPIPRPVYVVVDDAAAVFSTEPE
jgi:hypothetical protein